MTKYKQVNFKTSDQLFSAVMANGKSYNIPQFQRDYSWNTDNWQDLWSDIEQMLEKKEQHFMGYLLLQTDDGNAFDVIDGQQRLTTLSIVILAIMKQLEVLINQDKDKGGNTERLENYHRTYIGVWDSVTLDTMPKLILNRHNRQHFRGMVDRLDTAQRRHVLYTNRQLNKAFRHFYEQVKNITSGGDLARIIEGIANGLLFTVITVTDDIDAYTVFETLNARGVRLSTPDLLKNYMLSIMAERDKFTDQSFDDFDERWAGVLDQLGETEFTSFLRSQQGMKARLPHKTDLYRVLKNQLNNSETVFPYLKELEKTAPVYAALQYPEDEFWKTGEYSQQHQEMKKHLEVLSLFKIKMPLSLLMTGFFQFEFKDFVKLLQYIVAVTIRYNVICQKSTNDQEKLYNKISNQVWEKGLSVSEVANQLGPLYPKNEEFVYNFTNKSMPSKQSPKRVAFLLRAIERQLSNDDPPQSLTLEHILPYNPDDSWQEYFDREPVTQAIDRLGNMALLPANQNMGQESFEEKREVLRQSGYKINQHIAEYTEWNIEMLHDHQKWLAKQAKTVWKISQLEQNT